jgi:chromosome segregation ATPase
MRKKKLRKKLAEAYAEIENLQSTNQSLAQSEAIVSSRYESVRARLYSETNELSDRVRQAEKQNRQLEARIAELEKDCDRLDQESLARSDVINSLQKQNKALKEHVAYLEKIKLYGKVTASETLDASHESIAELPIDNKGTLGIH